MPSPSRHERQATDNETLSNELRTEYSSYNDWVITTLFYSAIHYIEAELIRHNIRSFDHDDRAENIVQCGAIPNSVQASHEYLRNESQDARYDCRQFSTSEVQDSLDEFNDIKQDLGV